jgi:hypothetical protein
LQYSKPSPSLLAPRRKGSGGLAVALIAVLAVGLVAVGALAAHWKLEAAGAQRQADREHRQAQSLQVQVDDLHNKSRSLEAQASNPVVSIWNSCGTPCDIGPGRVRLGGVPDTFVLHVKYTSTTPVAIYFFGYHQWTQFDDCGLKTSCVTGSYVSYPPATQRDLEFNDATGCAGYVYVMAAAQSGTIQPDLRASYKPADHPTGICAAGGT